MTGVYARSGEFTRLPCSASVQCGGGDGEENARRRQAPCGAPKAGQPGRGGGRGSVEGARGPAAVAAVSEHPAGPAADGAVQLVVRDQGRGLERQVGEGRARHLFDPVRDGVALVRAAIGCEDGVVHDGEGDGAEELGGWGLALARERVAGGSDTFFVARVLQELAEQEIAKLLIADVWGSLCEREEKRIFPRARLHLAAHSKGWIP